MQSVQAKEHRPKDDVHALKQHMVVGAHLANVPLSDMYPGRFIAADGRHFAEIFLERIRQLRVIGKFIQKHV